MIKFEHVNMVVSDLEKTLSFYQTAFPHWKVRAQGSRPWYGKPSNWIHFGDDYQYLAFSDHGEGSNRDLSGHSTGLAHIAFEVSNIEAMIERLTQQGFEIAIDGADSAVRKNVYFIDPDGFEVEFIEYLTDIPGERNTID